MRLDGSSNVPAILCMFVSERHSVYMRVVSSSSYKVKTDGVYGYIYIGERFPSGGEKDVT